MIDIAAQLCWFERLTTSDDVDLKARGVYQYLLGVALSGGRGYTALASQDELAKKLHTSKGTVSASLKKLADLGVIRASRGKIALLPPEENWYANFQTQYRFQYQKTNSTVLNEDSEKSQLDSCARRAATDSAFPLQGEKVVSIESATGTDAITPALKAQGAPERPRAENVSFLGLSTQELIRRFSQK